MHGKNTLYLKLNSAYAEIFKVLMDFSSTAEDVAEVFLDKAKMLTGSKFGYVNTIDPVSGIAASRTISKMMGKECHTTGKDNRIAFPPGKDGKYPTLWGFPLNNRKPFYTNTPREHTSSTGTPKGHIPVKNFLSIPVIINGALIGQIALANKESGYTESDLDMVEKLTDFYAIALRIKETEIGIEKEKSKPKFLLDNMYEGLWQIDKDAVTIFANPKMAEMLGYTVEEMLGKKLFDFIYSDSIKNAENNLKRRKKGIKEEHDFEFKRKDGNKIYTRIETAPLFDKDGNYDGALANVTDITEKKQMEDSLRSSEKMLKNIFDILPVGLWVADKNGKLILSNKKGREIWGAEPLVGQEAYGVFKARRLPSGKEIEPDDWALAHTINEGATVVDEMLEIDAFDGKKKIILNYTAPVLNENGKVDFGIIVNLDISDRVNAEKKVLKNEIRYRRLFESSPFAIVILNKLGVVISCNEATASYAGIPLGEIVGKHFTKIGVLKIREIPKYIKIFTDLLQGKITEPFNISFYKKKGEKLVAEAHISVLKEDNKVLGIQAILRDVTKEIRAEYELKKSYKQAKKTLEGTINTLSSILEIKDPYTGNHQRNVAKLCRAIALELGISKEETDMIYTEALIHDIGKIAIPASILSKPSELTNIEVEMIHAHSQVGYEILSKIDFGYPLPEIVLQHHERLDGSGYPNKIKDKDIIFHAKILAVADTVEAMANHRPYRPSLGIDKALKEVQAGKGKVFDESVVDACLTVFNNKKFNF